MLVSAACQSKRGEKKLGREFPSRTASANWQLTRRPSYQVRNSLFVLTAQESADPTERKLIHTQRDQRIDAGGAPRGKVAGQERDAHQQQSDARIGERICRTNAVKQAPGHAGDR